MKKMNEKNTGFTLIELMIVVAIVGILAGIAYPSYQDSVRKSRRADAKAALMGFANAMERHFTVKNTYLGAAGTPANPADTGAPRIFATKSPLDGATKYYDLTIHEATPTTYKLRATPIDPGPQKGDGFLQITNTQSRGGWDRNDDKTISSGTNEVTWD